MKYIVFASCIHVDILSKQGADKFLEEVTDFFCSDFEGVDEELLNLYLKKTERYGSFIYISEQKYRQLVAHSDD